MGSGATEWARPKSEPGEGRAIPRQSSLNTRHPLTVRQAEGRLTTSRAATSVESSVVWQALTRAVDRAAGTLANSNETEATELRRQLGDLVARLWLQSTAGSPPGLSTQADVPPAWVAALRIAFVQQLAAEPRAPEGRELVRVLSTLETLGQINVPSRTQFTQQLSSPDALRAVVEMAHDMRSPLGSILFLVDTIRRGQSGGVNPVQERQLGLIYGAALGLSTLASDVVDAINGDRLVDGRSIPFSISEVMLNVCAIVRPLGEEKGLVLRTTFPQVDGRLGYPSALSRVLLNLTSNAVRYTERGSVSVGCTELTQTRVEFWIEDTGRGIPDSVLAMLFDGFRPAAAGMRFSSAGLGLAICRNLLEKMASSLQVKTEIEQGTRFSFEIELPPA
jgi:signal transduction histidine kinase